jgi:hypothetical protein
LKEYNDLIFAFRRLQLAEEVLSVSGIRKINGWNLSEGTKYSTKDFHGFPLFLQANVSLAAQARLILALPFQ